MIIGIVFFLWFEHINLFSIWTKIIGIFCLALLVLISFFNSNNCDNKVVIPMLTTRSRHYRLLSHKKNYQQYLESILCFHSLYIKSWCILYARSALRREDYKVYRTWDFSLFWVSSLENIFVSFSVLIKNYQTKYSISTPFLLRLQSPHQLIVSFDCCNIIPILSKSN